MSAPSPKPQDQAAYWNDEGGRRWVENIERVERMLQPLSQRLLEGAKPAAGEHVLDVGCGGGVTSAAFAEAVGPAGHVTGADVSAVILDVAKQRYGARGNLEFALGDCAALPFAPARFDLLASRFGVMFFPEPGEAFAHLRKAVKPGGRLAFLAWRALDMNPWMGVPVQAAFSVLPRPEPPPPHAPGPFAFADGARLQDLLEGAGWREVRLETVEAMLDLGDPDMAVQQMIRMGPPAPIFAQADAATQAQVVAAVTRAFAPHVADGRITMRGATWLVHATAP
jgi:SAM-dependent methyltransferase